jgi:hypothetical protein
MCPRKISDSRYAFRIFQMIAAVVGAPPLPRSRYTCSGFFVLGVLAPYAASENVSTRGRWRGSGPLTHLNCLRC